MNDSSKIQYFIGTRCMKNQFGIAERRLYELCYTDDGFLHYRVNDFWFIEDFNLIRKYALAIIEALNIPVYDLDNFPNLFTPDLNDYFDSHNL